MPTTRDLMGSGQAPFAAQAIVGTTAALTATGSSSQTTAALMTAETNIVTSASSLNSVVLPTSAQGSGLGETRYVFTSSSTSTIVYPGGSETANGSTSGITVAQNKLLILKRISSIAWGYVITA